MPGECLIHSYYTTKYYFALVSQYLVALYGVIYQKESVTTRLRGLLELCLLEPVSWHCVGAQVKYGSHISVPSI